VIAGAAEEVSDGVVDAVEDGAGAGADDDNLYLELKSKFFIELRIQPT
jgi:hypothetical protein